MVSPGTTRSFGKTSFSMTRVLRHRGPDDEGFFLETYADGLASGSDSVAYRSSTSRPATSRSRTRTATVQLVFNGEIYNFRELRAGAGGSRASLRHQCRHRGDRPPLRGAWASRCVERLNGMFAFALWDIRRGALVLARDRFGKKPLYYAELGDSLVFGSELKALLQHPRCPRTLDFDEPHPIPRLEYVPAPRAIIEGVREAARPATACAGASGATSVEPYWDLRSQRRRHPLRTTSTSRSSATIFAQAVRRRLISDVPLGAFLSGGIDSSSVVALMVEALPAERGQDLLDRLRRARASTSPITHAASRSTSAPTITRTSSPPR